MKKILWLSRHALSLTEKSRFQQRLKGQITQDIRSLKDAEDVLQRLKNGGYTDVVLAAPLDLIDTLVNFFHVQPVITQRQWGQGITLRRILKVEKRFSQILPQASERGQRLLWVSDHNILSVQMEELKRLFGPNIQVTHSEAWRSAAKIKEEFETGHYDDIIVVTTDWCLYYLTELGVKPLWVQMRQVARGLPADLSYDGRNFIFVEFRRLEMIEITFGEV